MNDNISVFPGETDVTVLLEKAKSWGLTQVVICGWDGKEEFRFGSSTNKMPDIYWLIKNVELQFDYMMQSGD